MSVSWGLGHVSVVLTSGSELEDIVASDTSLLVVDRERLSGVV